MPSNFTIEPYKIDKVDSIWSNKLNKAFRGNLDCINQMLSDSRAEAWTEQLSKAKDEAISKSYSKSVNISVSVDPVTFDKDFDSDVKIIVTNKSNKTLSVFRNVREQK